MPRAFGPRRHIRLWMGRLTVRRDRAPGATGSFSRPCAAGCCARRASPLPRTWTCAPTPYPRSLAGTRPVEVTTRATQRLESLGVARILGGEGDGKPPGTVHDIKPRADEKMGVYRPPDGPIDRPPRPCVKCTKTFQPTIRRRGLSPRGRGNPSRLDASNRRDVRQSTLPTPRPTQRKPRERHVRASLLFLSVW